MKSILKSTKKLEDGSTTQSSSICALRWNLPQEDIQAHSSAPSRPVQPNDLTRNSQQQQPRQNGLKDLRSLQECVLFIQHWKEQVDQVCKGGWDSEEGPSTKEGKRSDTRTEQSLEESRKLILEWAEELRHVDKLLKESPWASECQENKDDKNPHEEAQMRIMEWAKELQTATESCGVHSEDLGKVLRLLGLKKKRLVKLLPLLEFITWSLLKEDSMRMIPKVWLLAKQKTWKAGIPRYIPNSVWSWICSASADVSLDPMTSHPWLQMSDDQRMVQEGLTPSNLPDNPQRFDSWPCVLGWEGYSSGRHYWEVDIANKGYWRVGLATANSKRQGRFPMNPKQGFWALWRSTHDFFACTKPETPLPVGLVAKRMGIYLDYEEGQISFYNAETKSHIYTFTGTFREKLYPLFAPLDGRTLMRIMPPHEISK
ncbi:zinc-binding protein A33 isoform X4 [Paralichthys olivaceus]|uniref:zinc-binding protein A33 isoform X4 n=1 Tax=Paralichthys olivaceus TaxID=8255 RepID=UPI00097D36B8|nr:PREDICTED: zinc-binding protein A33-like isoform X1 [Paralichthys olivaceus]